MASHSVKIIAGVWDEASRRLGTVGRSVESIGQLFKVAGVLGKEELADSFRQANRQAFTLIKNSFRKDMKNATDFRS
jgi:hypothetical protein